MKPSIRPKTPALGTATNAYHLGLFQLVDFDAWKKSLLVEGRARWEAYRKLMDGKTVLGYRILDRVTFWKRVAAGDYAVFEHLAPAIIGVGNLPYLPPVPVYNEFHALNLLAEIMEPSEGSVPVADFLENNVKSLDLGERTPWFVRPNNWKIK